jgi:hypothetical protein
MNAGRKKTYRKKAPLHTEKVVADLRIGLERHPKRELFRWVDKAYSLIV